MYYFSKLKHIAHHKAKNKTQSKQTSVSMHAHTHTHTVTRTSRERWDFKDVSVFDDLMWKGRLLLSWEDSTVHVPFVLISS